MHFVCNIVVIFAYILCKVKSGMSARGEDIRQQCCYMFETRLLVCRVAAQGES